MPWFKIDDSAHSHPKLVKAGNAALGLWMRCGSYAAQHLTEGIVPGVIAQMYGTGPQAAKLVKAGLWHQAGHGCPRCVQPADGDYVMHDFLENGRNVTKAQAEASREAAADRQRKRRAKQNADGNADDSQTKTDRIHDESSANRERKDPQFPQIDAGQDGVSQRDAIEGVTPPQANHQAGTSVGSTSKAGQGASDNSGGIPDFALPLVNAMAANGLRGIRWNLQHQDWFHVHALIIAKGVDAMAEHAVRSSHSATRPVVSARYFLDGWKDLPNEAPSPEPGPKQFQLLPGGGQPPHDPRYARGTGSYVDPNATYSEDPKVVFGLQ